MLSSRPTTLRRLTRQLLRNCITALHFYRNFTFLQKLHYTFCCILDFSHVPEPRIVSLVPPVILPLVGYKLVTLPSCPSETKVLIMK